MIPVLAPLSPVVLGHSNIGPSTGYMAAHYGDWPRLVQEALSVATAAAELSALSEPELPTLAAYLGSRPTLPFQYLAVHAPTKALDRPEEEVVAHLEAIASVVDAIVVHPDCLGDTSLYRQLGTKLVIETSTAAKAEAGRLRSSWSTSTSCQMPDSASTSPMPAPSIPLFTKPTRS